ncbi:MAG TPA: MFS transporter [Opitutaceae bacterium]|nr:MFS transporter [Opitutaceae bacterium]
MNSHKLSLREKLAYGCGDFASCLFWATFGSFLFIFYTDVFGISAIAVGTMLGISRALDAFFDPAMGLLADRTRTRWGKFRPYLLWVAVPFAVAGVLLFTTPHLAETGKLVWAYVTYNLMMALYSAINIPYTALLGVITPDSIERTKVSSVKFIFAFAANIAVQAVLLTLVNRFGGDNPQRGWQLAAMVVAATAMVFFFIAFIGTKERVAPPVHQKTSPIKDLGDLVRNGPWLTLVGATVAFVLFVATQSTVSAHYIKYFVGSQQLALPWNTAPQLYTYDQSISVFLTAGSIGALIGVVATGPVVNRIGKKAAYIGFFAVAISSRLGFFWLGPEQLMMMICLHFISSLAGGPLSVILWAMYADTADYSEWKRGRRATGLIFSASIMSQKFCWAIAGVVVGWMLNATGFIPNVQQSASVRHGLVLLISIVPSIFGTISIILVLFYRLNEKRVAEIQADLTERRAINPA